MNKKDLEALNKITRNGLIWVNGTGHEFRYDDDVLPTTRLKCRNNLCNTEDVFAISKCYLFASRRKGIIARCHKCGKITIVPAETFNIKSVQHRQKRNIKLLGLSTEECERRLMERNGVEKEDIEMKCEFFRDEWKKEDRKNEIQRKNWEAENRLRWAEEERKKEAASFKSKLDAGIYKYDTGARAFYEVSTGKIVRKL